MSQPLGYAVGNAVEVMEVSQVLHNEGPDDLKRLSLELAARMIFLAKLVPTLDDARDLAVRKLTRTALERHGYRVLEAGNGVEALWMWEQHKERVQLVLTDMVMPEGVSGRDLAAQLQAHNPDLRVIFTSGYSADLDGHDSFAVGCSHSWTTRIA